MSVEQRQFVHALWGSVAQEWSERADFIDARGAYLTAALIEGARVDADSDVLAMADGPGGMALAVAPLVRRVVTSDVVPVMVETAAKRAANAGFSNIDAAVLDLEAIDQPDASFDAVVIREGLMFALDPLQALREICRVLRPGGRLAAAVWGRPDDNPWLGIVMNAVSEVVGQQLPPPGMPGPFALSDSAELARLAAEAGFTDAAVGTIEVRFQSASYDDWFAHTTALAGPLANHVARMGEADLARLHELLRVATAPFTSADGTLDFPGSSLVLTATTPTAGS